jgi:hypothetical protein
MRPVLGVSLELIALAFVLVVASRLADLYPLSVLVLLLAQALTAVLIHCPAHYLVGRALGIRFSRIRLGHSTAIRVLPNSLKWFGSLVLVPSLSVDSPSRKTVPASRMRAMYLSGVSGSAGGTVVFALAVGLTGSFLTTLLTFLFALAYLSSEIKFSPAYGDVMRARAAAAARI